MRISRTRFNQRGLTLLELLVVMTILIALSTVAITSTSGVADQARYEATQRTLENIRDAVIGPANLRDTDGTLLYTGFVADTGRLPRAVDDGVSFTLAELWENVHGLETYQVRQATGANVNLVADGDPDVYVATGWRGPYLRLAPGQTGLRDGWGNSLKLRTSIPADVAASGEAVASVHSFGANGSESVLDNGYDLDLPVSFIDETNASLDVTVQILQANGLPAPTPANGSPARIIVRLFGPDPSNGLIRVLSVSADFEENAMTPPFATSCKHVSLPSLTPGPYVLRAYYDGNNDDYDPAETATDRASLIHDIHVHPRGNKKTVNLIVP